MTLIPYHLDEDGGAMLSLQSVNEERDVVQDVQVRERTSNDTPLVEYKSRIEELDELQEDVFALYEAELYPRETGDLEGQFSALSSDE